MFKSILFVCTLLTGVSFGQNLQSEINTQVWKPYIQAYNSFNSESFLSVYSKNVIRIPRELNKVMDYTEYRQNILRENAHNKNYNIKVKLEVRFTQRIHQATTAFESGIYKIEVIENTGKPAIVYSRFEVIMKKENGIWKITTDIDGGGLPVTEKEFAALQGL